MDLRAELRRRLDVPPELLTDEFLDHVLLVADTTITPWLVDDPEPFRASVDEATVQLAVKLVDIAGRGILDPTGDGFLVVGAGTPRSASTAATRSRAAAMLTPTPRR